MTRVTVFGGAREVGGNQILLEEDGKGLLLDFGKNFKRELEVFDEFLQPKVNVALRDLLRLGLLPPIEGIYREDLVRPEGWEKAWEGPSDYFELPVRTYDEFVAEERRPAVEGVLLSHAHMDHAAYIHYLDPRIPVVCLPVTRTILEVIEDTSKTRRPEFRGARRRRVELIAGPNSSFPNRSHRIRGEDDEPERRRYVEAPPHKAIKVGRFQVTAIPVDHSVPGAAAYLVRTPKNKTVFYTGDFRFHGRDDAATARLLEVTRGLEPDVLLCEGTRVASEKQLREDDVARSLRDVVRTTKGLVCVDFNWKDVTRFDTLMQAAEASKRRLVVSPELAYLLRRLSEKHPRQFRPLEAYDGAAVFLRRTDSALYSPADYARKKTDAGYLASWEEVKGALRDLPRDHPALHHFHHGARAPEIREHPERFLMMLSYFEMNDLPDLQPPKGSLYIRAACEPLNVEMETDAHKQKRWLERFGFQHNIPKVEACRDHEHPKGGLEGTLAHVSGHAPGPDLKRFVKAIRPKVLVPVHTERPEAFEGWAREVTRAAKTGEVHKVEF